MNSERQRQIDDYVRGKLEASELDSFEIAMMADGELLAEIERALQLQNGLEREDIGARTAVVEKPFWKPIALAASIAAAVSTSLHWWVPTNSSAVLSLGQEARYESFRGASKTSRHIVASEPSLIRFDVAGYDNQLFNIKIADKSGEVKHNLTATALNEFVTLALPGMEPGIYAITLTGEDCNKEYELAVK